MTTNDLVAVTNSDLTKVDIFTEKYIFSEWQEVDGEPAEHTFDLQETSSTYQWDQILIFAYGIVLLGGGTLANGLVLFLTIKEKKFHETFMYIRAAYSVFDILMVWTTVPFVMINVLYDIESQTILCYVGDMGIGLFLTTVHLTMLIALERYFYFCHPMKYQRFFNLKTICLACTALIIFTQVSCFEIIYVA